ncbi:hypothetical protein MMC28_001163 [Mycoblastus sanguinarius]|nr:hypothetical protein [Mycoblastus sanguinarius]
MPLRTEDRKRKFDQIVFDDDESREDFMGLNDHPDQYFCDDCRRLDIKEFFKEDTLRPRKRKLTNGVLIAKLSCEWEKATCRLCRLFAAVRVPPSHDYNHSEYHLRALSFLQATPDIGHDPIKAIRDKDTVCPAVLPGNGKSKVNLDREIFRCETTGLISCVPTSDSSVSSRFQGRRLQSNCIDYQLLRAWFEFCERNHPKSCALDSATQPPMLKVIDAETHSIIQAPPACLYVALSYVWGSQNSQNFGIAVGAQTWLPKEIPRVIEDALLVTRKLGWRYLWVDRYCINQLDETERHTQIGNMDSVYEHAVATIVAAAGDDADFGLPGVRNVRKEQPFAVVQGMLLASTLRRPENLIEDSQWATRGWTYQEAVMSRRRLVFTSDQVYFECKSMNCCESISKPLALLHRKKGREGLRSSVRRGYFEAHRGIGGGRNYGGPLDRDDDFSEFRSHVEQFTARKLSYPSDALEGLHGYLRPF